MPREELPPDPESQAKWDALPKNSPSKQALPPVAGGSRWVWGLLIIFGALAILSLIAQGGL